MPASLMAFTTPQAVRLAGLSASTIHYWEESGVFRATYVDERPKRPYRRFYTFSDIVSLRTLRTLRRDHGIQLGQLREVGKYLTDHRESPWSSIRFGVRGRTILFPDPVTGNIVAGKPLGQSVMIFEVEPVARSAEEEAQELRKRDPNDIGKITRHRNVMSNAWVVAGTRITTSAIWSFHEDGFSIDRILRAYPDLTTKDIESAIQHEADSRGLAA